MNIILFSPGEVQLPLPRRDERARHILGVLRCAPGESFDAGLVDGPRGKGTLVAVAPDHLVLRFAWGEPPAPLAPLHLLVGLARPQTVRDILREGASLGVGAISFVRAGRSDAAYAQSSVWQPDEIARLLRTGAAQAFCTRLPVVHAPAPLSATLATLPAEAQRVALDHYEAAGPLTAFRAERGRPVVLAIGGERGWDDADRAQLRAHGFTLAHLGPRVLRTETACIAAVSLVKAQAGWD